MRWRDHVILEVIRTAIRHKILCVILIGIAGFVGMSATMFMQPFYVARAKIYPPMNDNPLGGFGIAGMAGLLGNLGINAAGSSQFPLYEQVLYGRELLTKLLQSPTPWMGPEATVMDYLKITADDPTVRQAIGIGLLRKKLIYEADTKTAVVTISARDSEPRAAAFLVNRAIDLLNEFDVSTSSMQARERRQFIEGRLLEASGTLAQAEANLEEFHAQNVRINAPHLILQEARLRRELEIEQQIYLTLRKEAELASIEEQRSVPVVNVLERATPPLAAAGPSQLRNGILAGMLATMLLIAVLTWRAAEPVKLMRKLGLFEARR